MSSINNQPLSENHKNTINSEITSVPKKDCKDCKDFKVFSLSGDIVAGFFRQCDSGKRREHSDQIANDHCCECVCIACLIPATLIDIFTVPCRFLKFKL